MTSLPPKRWGFSKAPPVTVWPLTRSTTRKTTVVVPTSMARPEQAAACLVEGQAVVEDHVALDGDHGVDLAGGLARGLQDVHAPADDGELDVLVDRDDRGLAGEAEVLGQVGLRLGARREGLSSPADLDDALAAASRPPARLGDGDGDLVRVVEERLAGLERPAVDAMDDLGHEDS